MKEFTQIVCTMVVLGSVAFVGNHVVTTNSVNQGLAKLRTAYVQNGDRIIAAHNERARRIHPHVTLLSSGGD